MFSFCHFFFGLPILFNWKEITDRIFEAYDNPKPIELGRMLGIDRATVSKWTSEDKKTRRHPALEHLGKVVAEKNVTWDWLLEGRGPKYREKEK